jgi:hypothetical protein
VELGVANMNDQFWFGSHGLRRVPSHEQLKYERRVVSGFEILPFGSRSTTWNPDGLDEIVNMNSID